MNKSRIVRDLVIVSPIYLISLAVSWRLYGKTTEQHHVVAAFLFWPVMGLVGVFTVLFLAGLICFFIKALVGRWFVKKKPVRPV